MPNICQKRNSYFRFPFIFVFNISNSLLRPNTGKKLADQEPIRVCLLPSAWCGFLLNIFNRVLPANHRGRFMKCLVNFPLAMTDAVPGLLVRSHPLSISSDDAWSDGGSAGLFTDDSGEASSSVSAAPLPGPEITKYASPRARNNDGRWMVDAAGW